MDSKDVFQRNMKAKPSNVVQNPQELMVGLKEKKEEEVKVITDVENFDSYEEISDKTKADFKERGIETLFPIQQACFKDIYNDNDLIGRDLTGSGKTLAFCLPLVERYRKLGYFNATKGHVRNLLAVMLTPTRELAMQVAQELKKLMHKEHEYKVLTVYGGVPIDHQTRELRYGVDFFVGTTGRVLDHIERGNIDFSGLKAVVLDEADQMLNMGFQEDIEAIMAKVNNQVEKKPQFLLFSATIPDWLKGVAQSYLNKDYKLVDLCKNLRNKTSNTVNHLALNCPFSNKIPVLADVLRCYGGLKGKAIVFCETKMEANDIILSERMRNNAEVLHGDIAQKQREITLKRFREGKFNVLVATNVAARGLDITNVDLIIQLEPPKEIEAYIHRSGRTARAGKDGMCITFYSGREYQIIEEIEYQAGIKFRKISPPNNDDIIKVAAVDVIDQLKGVDKKILPHFEECAEKFLEEFSAKEALCMALAFISETSNEQLSAKSMISGEEGVVTYILKCEREVRNVSYGHSLIERNFSENMTRKAKGIKVLASGDGIAFDIPENEADNLDKEFKLNCIENKGLPFTLERASVVPELSNEGRYGGGGGSRGGYGGGGKKFYGGQSQGYSGGGGNKFSSRGGRGGHRGGYDGDSSYSHGGGDSKVGGISFGNKPSFSRANGGGEDSGIWRNKGGDDSASSSRGDRGGRGGFRGRGDRGHRGGRGFRGNRGDRGGY